MSLSFTPPSGTKPSIRLAGSWRFFLAAAACAGVWARLSGFGERQLTVDETFSLRAAQAILEHGLPRLLDGGLYVQGLIPHYLAASSIAVFGSNDWAFRLPALLAGLALPALAYRYARQHGSAAFAACLAAAMLLSSWQIELSRFGRMYALFGCATLLFLSKLDRLDTDGGWRALYGPLGWAWATVLCHLEGALLAPLLLTPLLERSRFSNSSQRLQYGLVTGANVAAIAAFALFDFRRWGVPTPFPMGYAPPETNTLRMPESVLWGPGLDAPSGFVLTACGLGLALLWATARVKRGCLDEQGAIAVVGFAGALMHQLALAGVFAATLFARSRTGRARQRLAARLGWITAAAAVWPMAAVLAGLVPEGALGLGAWRRLLFAWPDFYASSIRPWAASYPMLGAAIVVAVAYLWVRNGKVGWRAMLAGPGGVAAYGIVCLGAVRYFYESIRYHYFLYPVLVTALGVALIQALGARRGPVAFIAVFLLSGDFDYRHIACTASPAVEFRLGPYERRADAWYARSDYLGAADALEKLGRATGSRVVIGTAEAVSHHFAGEHVRYLDRAEYPFWEQSRQRGTVEMWTGRRLLSSAEEVRRWSQGRTEVLLVRRRPGDLQELDPRTIWAERLVATHEEFLSLDGGVDIVRVELRP